jgi:hypothetical protein
LESTSYEKKTVSLRKLPYPYQAGLAICSDIDETQTTDEFLEIQKFLNTKFTTSMGEGVGLEIGNSFYFYDAKSHFAYFNRDERAREVIIDLIHAGYMDCLHTYGDAAFTRNQIRRALDDLDTADCKIHVWINHYNAPSNLSRKFEYMFNHCLGDDPNSEVYHADLTLEYGIQYAWVGATMRVIGQSPNNPSSAWSTVFDRLYPIRSFISVLKEIRKTVLGQLGDERYIMQRQCQLMRPLQLEDGRQVHEFSRYCNHPISVGQGATSRGLSYAISRRALEYLKARQGFMIVYTHFGKNGDCRQVISPETRTALRNLECEFRDGQIYVTTTSKLLSYYKSSQYLVWSHQQTNGCTRISINHLDDPVFGKKTPTIDQLQGLTFYVPESSRAEVYIKGVAVNGIRRNPADESGRESVTLPFTYLTFPY